MFLIHGHKLIGNAIDVYFTWMNSNIHLTVLKATELQMPNCRKYKIFNFKKISVIFVFGALKYDN